MTDPFANRLNKALTELIQARPVDGEAVRVTAATTLTDLFLETSGRDAAARPAHFRELMSALLPHIPREARAGIARRLAHCPALPGEIARRLADDNYEIAGPVLRQSPVLSQDDLLAVVRGPCSRKARAVAGRNGLSPALVAALLDRGDMTIAADLAERGARLDGDEASRIALMADLPPAAARRLVEVAGLTDTALAALFWRTDSEGRRRIIGRLDRRREALPPEPAASGAVAPAGGLDDLLQLAAARRRDEIAARLADVLGLPGTIGRRIVDDPSGEALAVAGRAAGLPVEQMTGVVLLTAADPGASYDALRDLVALAEMVDAALARHLVALWARAEAPRPTSRPTAARHEPAIAQPGARRRPGAREPQPDLDRIVGDIVKERRS